MNPVFSTGIGKLVRSVVRMRGGGSAFPGRVVERLNPRFLHDVLSQLPYGVVLVSGTNGKTTTTRMIATMFEQLGLRVFTNRTGSNFTRGVISAALAEMTWSGALRADIAVLELDEAYAVHFVRQFQPQYAVLLNVMRDQLDRFGEIDNTAHLLQQVAQATTRGVVLNREDRRIANIATALPTDVSATYFGLAPELRSLFPNDDELHCDDHSCGNVGEMSAADGEPVENQPLENNTALNQVYSSPSSASQTIPASVVLSKLHSHEALFNIEGNALEATLQLEGVYNVYNAAAALAIVRKVLSDHGNGISDSAIVRALSVVTPAFGRGESIALHNGDVVDLVLVKNPAGFRLALTSFDSHDVQTMIVINDEYADGRDMSWLWDVDFRTLQSEGVAVVSGVRAWDMALRLSYDNIEIGEVNADIGVALQTLLNSGVVQHGQAGQSVTSDFSVDLDDKKYNVSRETNGVKSLENGKIKTIGSDYLQRKKHYRIFCTYTAMLDIRRQLTAFADVVDAGL